MMTAMMMIIWWNGILFSQWCVQCAYFHWIKSFLRQLHFSTTHELPFLHVSFLRAKFLWRKNNNFSIALFCGKTGIRCHPPRLISTHLWWTSRLFLHFLSAKWNTSFRSFYIHLGTILLGFWQFITILLQITKLNKAWLTVGKNNM